MNDDLNEAESSATKENSAFGVGTLKTISTKNAVIIAVVIVLGALGFYYKGAFVAATVNGSSISRLAVIRELEKESGKKALDMLITQKLIDSEASKNKITVSAEEVDTEVKKIEEQVKMQGQDLDQALEAQGLTRDEFKRQIVIRKKMEKLLADKIQVTDEEVAAYIKTNKLTAPAGQEASFPDLVKEQLKQQKLNSEAGSYLDSIRSQAAIKYYIKY